MSRSIFLTPQKSEKLHEASIRVLVRTGVKLDHEESVDLFLSAGATMDDEKKVLIPRKLVDETIEKVKIVRVGNGGRGGFLLYDRDGENPINIEMGKTCLRSPSALKAREKIIESYEWILFVGGKAAVRFEI
ncbi:MAG: trimethylamine methyltransferase family protein [Deltaproteobacteria bacterium]|uniref:Trimethylamine methyltransferase family protein n=1 Tax=Candidatus Zymogenus saltonus TaxID=2844893 RepID=A0A9D8PN46_9DELT|nr:trimethylamine methyltransferase family protein [Candidatus Zymogenus saltonus]